VTFPTLRLRRTGGLLDLPWELPLADWPDELGFRDLPVGPSRHLVRFLVRDGSLLALKAEPIAVAEREYDVLAHLERANLPAVIPIGVARQAATDSAILVTEYLAHSLQLRRLLARFPLGPGAYRDRLLDAMAWLLVELHRGGVYWGDCSLANTLFRRDGDRIQAVLVDAETSEVHPSLSDGQRAYDLEVLVENVAYGLADIAMLQDRPEDLDAAITDAESVRDRYAAIWRELHLEPLLPAGDRHAIRAQLRRLNDLGFAVDEIEIVPAGPDPEAGLGDGGRPGDGGAANDGGGLGDGAAGDVDGGLRVRLRATTTNRSFHAHELERLTGIRALEGQARLLLNDLREYAAWLQLQGGQRLDDPAAAGRWRREILEPSLVRLRPAIGSRDPIQAYCDVLEHKWLLSERAGRDVGLEAAIAAYLAEGAPAPESRGVADVGGVPEAGGSAGATLPGAAVDDLVE
jgi:hypothetical protein